MLITQTPLRISLAGGGTDFPEYYRRSGGAVVSTAIDKYIYVILNGRFDDRIYISYSRKEIVDSIDDIQHELVREAMRKAGIEKGIEIAIMADIPSDGCGLGSSSSLTVGLLNAFYAFKGLQVSPGRLAEEACEIEIDICGKPIGKQDQYIAAFGGLRYIAFNVDGTITAERLHGREGARELDGMLALFFTNVTRKSESILRTQSEDIEKNLEQLDGIKDLAERAREAIAGGDNGMIGKLLLENWQLKKRLAEGITDPAIDAMIDAALGAGALGCKISGAGGGGFLLACGSSSDMNLIRTAMAEHREMPFHLERCGSKVIFNVESYEWK